MAALNLDPRTAARALGGEAIGRNRVLAPGPGHSRKDRSLSVTLDRSAPDGFVVHSFADDDPLECRDHVRALLGLPAWAPGGERQDRLAPVSAERKQREPDPEEARRTEWLQARAREIWEEAKPHNPILTRYLTGARPERRGLAHPEDVMGRVLRFHPACPWKDDDGQLLRVPAMVAAMRCIFTDELRAVHRTRLTPDGLKAGHKPRKMLGATLNTAIKLDADADVTMGLVLGEGIETCLTMRQLNLRPVWALGSADPIGSFPILPGIEALTLLAERDKKGTNAKKIQACGARWHSAGRDVVVIEPPEGAGDANDAIQGGASQ